MVPCWSVHRTTCPWPSSTLDRDRARHPFRAKSRHEESGRRDGDPDCRPHSPPTSVPVPTRITTPRGSTITSTPTLGDALVLLAASPVRRARDRQVSIAGNPAIGLRRRLIQDHEPERRRRGGSHALRDRDRDRGPAWLGRCGGARGKRAPIPVEPAEPWARVQDDRPMEGTIVPSLGSAGGVDCTGRGSQGPVGGPVDEDGSRPGWSLSP